MITLVIPRYERWGSLGLQRCHQIPDDDDPYFKRVGVGVSVHDGFFQIFLLSVFFLFCLIHLFLKGTAGPSLRSEVSPALFIKKMTFFLLATALVIAFVHFENSFNWPDFTTRHLFQNLLSTR